MGDVICRLLGTGLALASAFPVPPMQLTVDFFYSQYGCSGEEMAFRNGSVVCTHATGWYFVSVRVAVL